MLSDQQFTRYLRQVSLPEVGESGQEKLLNQTILVIGCGGLGSAASLYLAGAGIGKIVLADGDKIELSNLPRQLTYTVEDVGKLKVDCLRQRLTALNPEVAIRTVNKPLRDEQLSIEISLADIVLDCTDNLKTRHAINSACVAQRKDLVSGSAIGWSGQVISFPFSNHINSGCYRCLYPFDELPETQRCSDSGVMGPVVGMIGLNQSLEAIKLTLGIAQENEAIKLFNGLMNSWQALSLAREHQCTVCAN
ncbi:HesA/MoeB/ThiF family protein [Vibrio hippocampi]|uniref:Sulfur carrier protein ThiS adenylyltransferase n=1 Tax=Vibrio hippocampi TaxID=654686 RepID=A0ABM8ZDH6_9VIBR|nr:HesA/MoeB/ThiF family protein [Vibrio hippocampi]CAH0524234.1 Sulfur carrier protein ThiS adenylyltransferase [Vibrio hippocampi]